MGTRNSPDIVVPITDISDGTLKSGLTSVKIVPVGGSLQNDAITLTELSSSGRYGKFTADGVDAVTQGIYLVYADDGDGDELRGIYIHGGEFVDTHLNDYTNPHVVSASQITVSDNGYYYTGTNIETILQEIGTSLSNLASPQNTLLTDGSTQQVASGKNTVTNFSADMVDYKHASNTANNIPVLDSNSKLPLDQIPDNLTGKDADSVDGKEPGSGNNNLAILSDNQSAGKLDTSLLGEKKADLIDRTNHTGTQPISTLSDHIKANHDSLNIDADTVDGDHANAFATAGHNHDTDYVNESEHTKAQHDALNINADQVDGKDVGSAAGDIPELSTTSETGKIDTSLLGKEWGGRTATINQNDNPAPGTGGGGTIWSEIRVTDETEHILDNSIDWRDRFVSLTGAIRVDPVSNILPGEENDQYLYGDTVNDSINCLFIGFMYSRTGCAGAGLQQTPHMRYSFAPGYDYVYVWVDHNDGKLCCGKQTNTNGTIYTMAMKIEYSSDQGHYS